MACITIVPPSGEADTAPVRKKFKPRGLTRPSAETVARQNAISLLSFQLHDAREEALAYINEHCPVLGGRPLDVAGESDAGLAIATRHLHERRGSAGASER